MYTLLTVSHVAAAGRTILGVPVNVNGHCVGRCTAVAGSVGRVGRVGSVGRVGRVGSVGSVGTAAVVGGLFTAQRLQPRGVVLVPQGQASTRQYFRFHDNAVTGVVTEPILKRTRRGGRAVARTSVSFLFPPFLTTLPCG